MAELIEAGLDAELNRIDPERIEERAQKRRAAAAKKRETAEASEKPKTTFLKMGGRSHIPNADRRQAMLRSDQRCEQVSPDGRRCSETSGLVVDHIIPVAKGGTNCPQNLQVLCRNHNYRKAELDFSVGFMDAKVAEARRKQADRSGAR